jgi:Bacterial transglutaminase, N-terminal domain
MHDILLSSKLSYEVQNPMVLLLNIAIATTDRQWPLWESLEVSAEVEATPLQVGPEKNRFHRLQLEPGEITIEYRARARMAPIVDPAPTIDQIDYAALPPVVMPYLNPSRYCESDRISAYAMAEFGAARRRSFVVRLSALKNQGFP